MGTDVSQTIKILKGGVGEIYAKVKIGEWMILYAFLIDFPSTMHIDFINSNLTL